jgi:nitric-oxide synthase, bacterial
MSGERSVAIVVQWWFRTGKDVIPEEEPRGREGEADRAEAEDFIRLHHAENPSAGPLKPRLREVFAEISQTGTYTHTPGELAFGARVAWRNSSRCIGRLYWQSLRIRDRRHVDTSAGIAEECVEHLRVATNRGRIRPTITVFAPDRLDEPAPRIWNDQLIRYAGYPRPDGGVTGDPANVAITEVAQLMGWRGEGTRFDVLPLIVQAKGRSTAYDLPADAVLEVPIRHPEFAWFADLGLRWHAVPVISNMCLEIGGVRYPCAPFNGWYMGTEVGARNLSDVNRYDQLPVVAAGLGVDTSCDRSLWRDQALVELNVAVLHSFAEDGVAMTDHHTESRRFMTHLAKEERSGRVCPADWSWIVPPLSGSATPVFHRYYDDVQLTPAFTPARPSGVEHSSVSDAEMTVLSQDDGPVRILTFNRPDRLNAWTPQMGTRYFDLLDEADQDPSVRVIVVTGAGRGFCAGADLQGLSGMLSNDSEMRPDERPNTYPISIRKPVIAAVNGACAGLGMVYALVCDVVFTAAEAKWTTAFVQRGLIAEYGLGWVLPKLVGHARAMDLLLASPILTGARVAEMGMVSRAVPRETLIDEVLAYAHGLAERSSPMSMAVIKRQLWSGWDADFGASYAEAVKLMLESFGRPDSAEGVRSFLESRPPSFPPLT